MEQGLQPRAITGFPWGGRLLQAKGLAQASPGHSELASDALGPTNARSPGANRVLVRPWR